MIKDLGRERTAYESSISELRAERNALLDRLAIADSQHRIDTENVVAQCDRIRELVAERDALKEDFSREHSARRSAETSKARMGDRISGLEAELDELQSTLADMQTENELICKDSLTQSNQFRADIEHMDEICVVRENRIRELEAVLRELVDLVEDNMNGAYEFDSVTLQPARRALRDRGGGVMNAKGVLQFCHEMGMYSHNGSERKLYREAADAVEALIAERDALQAQFDASTQKLVEARAERDEFGKVYRGCLDEKIKANNRIRELEEAQERLLRESNSFGDALLRISTQTQDATADDMRRIATNALRGVEEE
jgi:chromosome segregation ATPase